MAQKRVPSLTDNAAVCRECRNVVIRLFSVFEVSSEKLAGWISNKMKWKISVVYLQALVLYVSIKPTVRQCDPITYGRLFTSFGYTMSVVARIRITSDLWPGVMCCTMWIIESIATSGLFSISLQSTANWQVTSFSVYIPCLDKKVPHYF